MTTSVVAPACNPHLARDFFRRLPEPQEDAQVDVVLLRKQLDGLHGLLEAEADRIGRVIVLDEPYYGCTTAASYEKLSGARRERDWERCFFPWGTFNANLFVLGSFLAREVTGINVYSEEEDFTEFPFVAGEDRGKSSAAGAGGSSPRADAARDEFRRAVHEARSLLEKHQDELVRANDGDHARSDTGLIRWFPAQVERAAMYASIIPDVAGKRLLEIGAGTGWGSYALAHVAGEVHAVDLARDMVDFCGKVMVRDNLTYSVAQAEKLDFPDEIFDVVLAIELIEHLEDPHHFLQEARRLLAPGGKLVLSTPDHRRFPWRALTAQARRRVEGVNDKSESELFREGWCSPHVQAYTVETLRAAVEAAGFEDVRTSFPTYAHGPSLAHTVTDHDARGEQEVQAALRRSVDWDVLDFDFPAAPSRIFGSFSFMSEARKPLA